tara:strand:+ start:3908 stop:4156 length:249 start_codon:yes stop_codon:yes gene_type:complete
MNRRNVTKAILGLLLAPIAWAKDKDKCGECETAELDELPDVLESEYMWTSTGYRYDPVTREWVYFKEQSDGLFAVRDGVYYS